MIVTASELGRRIKGLRLDQRMTLKQVGEAANLSATHLSQIERGQVSPTIGVLVRIAGALGKDPLYFMERDERQEVSHQPHDSRHRFTPAPGVTAEGLNSGNPGSRLFAYRLYFSGEGARLTLEAQVLPGDGLYFVQRGAVGSDFGYGPMRLAPGDAVQASLSRPHRLHAVGGEPIEVLAVLTSPIENHALANHGVQAGDAAVAGPLKLHSASVADASSTPAPHGTAKLGRRIKKIRTSLGLTLKDIEKRGGVSATHVSEIERGKASPTVVALGRISQALGLRAAVLLDLPMLPDVSAISGKDRGGHTVHWGNATLELLTEPVHGGTFGAHVLRLPVGQQPALTHRHEGEEWLTLLSGMAEIRMEDARYLLLEGDSLHFRAHVTHAYVNPASTPAVLLVACRPRIRL